MRAKHDVHIALITSKNTIFGELILGFSVVLGPRSRVSFIRLFRFYLRCSSKICSYFSLISYDNQSTLYVIISHSFGPFRNQLAIDFGEDLKVAFHIGPKLFNHLLLILFIEVQPQVLHQDF
jgi:hypothetical protein